MDPRPSLGAGRQAIASRETVCRSYMASSVTTRLASHYIATIGATTAEKLQRTSDGVHTDRSPSFSSPIPSTSTPITIRNAILTCAKKLT